MHFYNNNFKIINNITPGIPKMPVAIAVTILMPIWNPKTPPTKFTTNSNIAPKIEFPINLIINFSGRINIFPIINKKIIQPKYIIIELPSKTITLFFVLILFV